MSPIMDLLAIGFGLSVSLLILANIVLVAFSLARRRELALQWLAPLANVATLFLLSDSPREMDGGTPRENSAG